MPSYHSQDDRFLAVAHKEFHWAALRAEKRYRPAGVHQALSLRKWCSGSMLLHTSDFSTRLLRAADLRVQFHGDAADSRFELNFCDRLGRRWWINGATRCE